MRSRVGMILLVGLLGASGCAGYSAPPVDVRGTNEDMQQLAGEWHGTFQNRQLQRRGQIDFRMSASADSAFGEVVMYTESPTRPIWDRPRADAAAGASGPTWLRIRFVRVKSGYVNGEMEPMYDPACRCDVVARFIGRVKGDRIEGSFTSRSSQSTFESSGSWSVDRVTK